MKNKFVFLLIIIVFFSGCAKQKDKTGTPDEAGAIITQRAVDRKARTIEILKQHGIPYSEGLAPLPDENTVKSRTTAEAAYRAVCLALVAIKGDGMGENKSEKIAKIREKYKIDKYLTPQEKAFLETDNPTDEDSVLFSWRYEGYYLLLWALNFIPELNFPESTCNVEEVLAFLLDPEKGNFIKKAKLRSMTEIFNETDFIYRCHWAIIETETNNQTTPGGLSYDVVYERHYTLNWLIRYKNAEWDDVTADA